nr:MAG TPA: hypothetical protein [Caudoviricetes sp.]
MNSREFFDAVVKLRELQKSYYNVRTSTALTACKRQEKMIDEEIVRVKGKVEKDGQLRLLK